MKNSPELKAGVVVGLLNFAAYYTRLEAFKSGSVLLVSTISGMSILIVVGMSTLLLKERLTVRRCVALLLSLIAMMLVKT